MSSPTQPVTQISIPPKVHALIRRVRFRLRRDAVATGLLLTVCFAAVVFWVTTTLDIGWFLLQQLELPVGLRAILLGVMLPAVLWLLASRVCFPLLRRVRDLDIALILERRFPQFQDRLITSIETAKGLPVEGPLTRPMLERSIHEAEALAETVVSDEVFDISSVKRLSLFAGGLLLSLLITAIAQPQLLTRWWSAFVRCDETYHERTTDLKMVAIAQPGDRPVEFFPAGDQLLYRHPRGADLELEMFVPNGGPTEGQEWIVPDRVRVDVVRADGSRSRTYVSPTSSSNRRFRFVVTRLQEPITVELLAGDYQCRTPYRVEVVNSPGIDAIQLNCIYPEYTGWNQQRETTITVNGSEIELPIGTSIQLTANSSKALQGVRIVSDQFELSGDLEGSTLTQRDSQSSRSSGRRLISDDGMAFTARFEIVAPPAAGTEQQKTTGAPTKEESGSLDQNEAISPVLAIPSNTNLRFFLHDTDDVMSVSPETLRVRGQEDKPPVVVARMTGIDNAITRFAKIPVAGRIKDDYGLKSSSFEFLVDDESTWRPRPFRLAPGENTTDFELRRSDTEPFELFDVQVLELSEGQTLTLSITAEDRNILTGPGITRGEPMLFRIVSIEELLSLLYTREIALRGRFEEVISQLEEINNDLVFHKDVAARVDAGGANAAQQDRVSLTTSATRNGNNLRRQTNELGAIIEGFEEVVRQLINNAVPPQQLADNMRSSIVDPLKVVSSEMLPAADRAVSALRVAAQDGQPTEELVIEANIEVTKVIASLKVVLENVRDMAEFHEALRDLKAILDELQKNLNETKKLQKNQLIEDILK